MPETLHTKNGSVYLSWGMGAESTAILVRWLIDPSSRDFPLSALTILTAQTGDEWPDTKTLCETHILPLLRQHNVRLVQVARAGQFEKDGIEILDDTTQPEQLHIEGCYRLSDELRFAGTIPQYAGVHTCALKFKAFVLERWLQEEAPAGETIWQSFGYNRDEVRRIEKSEYAIARRIAFGFNAMERRRIDRANEYDSMKRESFYPLLEWNWSRQDCLDFLQQQFNVEFAKSCCAFCPFVNFKDNALLRFEQYPKEAAQALMLEYTSLCLNHRATLYKSRSLMSILRQAGHSRAVNEFHRLRTTTPTATYRVRRIMTSKGHGHRCTEIIPDSLSQLIKAKQLTPANFHTDDYQVETAYARERQENTYPTGEEFYVVAPSTVAARARHGIPWFDQRWLMLNQNQLF